MEDKNLDDSKKNKKDVLAIKKVGKGVTGFFHEFKKFISKGNIVDLAIAVVIGAAFSKIVNSLVSDIISPLITALLGKNDINELSIILKKATDDAPALILPYGLFLQAILDFLIVSMCIFIVLKLLINAKNNVEKLSRKQIKMLKKKLAIDEQEPVVEATTSEPEPEPEPEPETTEQILADIRNLLKENSKDESEKKAEKKDDIK